MITIIPSIASADPLNIHRELNRLKSINRLHIDIEDGNFINNITFGQKTVTSIVKEFSGEPDVHLLTTNPESYLPWLSELGIHMVCAHLEALPYPKKFLKNAQKLGMKAGIAINLKISVQELCSYMDAMDYVLVMTSEPDCGTQDFFPCALERVRQVRALLPPTVALWCDGGIRPETLPLLCAAGMDTAVIGRCIFAEPDPAAAILQYEKETQNHGA